MDRKEEEMKPVSEVGKLVVKLKVSIPNPNPNPIPNPNEEKKQHYCKECDKAFASGKALGGHMSSAHVQANKDYSSRTLSSRVKKHHKFSGTAEITCNLCKRGFRSEKSLFGHMRCHPERCYRGMEPPSPVVDDADPIKSWPPGVKRGRGPMGTLVRARDDAIASVHEIVRMVGSGPHKRAKSEDDDDDDDERVRTAVEVLEHMKGEKHMCDLCNHQALGGHMSTHTKLKLNNQSKPSVSDDDNKIPREKVVIGFDLNLMPEEEEEEDTN